ncbi:hypothetical protein [Oceanimonas marisflavi]|uniref:hypothetical protein n=1 Tax=Oceanimonas marisflavi TaxID=2059724 RepID=UPI0013008575|nr:hypothetical protein [Oceanimonas marisflavi]
MQRLTPLITTALILSMSQNLSHANEIHEINDCSYLKNANSESEKEIFNFLYPPGKGIRPSTHTFSLAQACTSRTKNLDTLKKEVELCLKNFPPVACEFKAALLKRQTLEVDYLLKEASTFKKIALEQAQQQKMERERAQQEASLKERMADIEAKKAAQTALVNHQEKMQEALKEQCVNEAPILREHDQNIMTQWKADLDDFKQAVSSGKNRYAAHLYQSKLKGVPDKSKLMIASDSNDACFQFDEYNKLEDMILAQLKNTQSSFETAMPDFIKIKNYISEKEQDELQEKKLTLTDTKVCKAATAAMFGRSPSIMNVTSRGKIHFVSYIRPSDNTKWQIKCYLDKNKIIWASANPDSSGRWRTQHVEYGDPVITYSIDNSGTTVTINEDFSDSVVTHSYSIAEL